MLQKRDGFTLTELLVALLVLSIVMAGAAGVFATHNRTSAQQDVTVMLQENLRMGMGMVTDALRTSGHLGVPPLSDLSGWIPGFAKNPQVTPGTGGGPATIGIAGCMLPPVTTLSTGLPNPGATSITVVDATAVTSNMILIGDLENAKIQSVAGNTLTIDTDPLIAGNQGLARAYPAGAPVCRVDVLRFAIQTDTGTGRSWLTRAENGGDAQPIAEGITDLQVATLTPDRQYAITLSGRSERPDPVSGNHITQVLQSVVTLKNPIGGL